MRLLQIVQRPQRRGAETFARQFGAELRRRGWEVRTAYLEPAPRVAGLPLEAWEIVLRSGENPLWERLPGVDPMRLGRLLRLTRDFRPDVIQVGGGRTVKYAAALRICRPRAPWILVCRNIGRADDWVRGPLRRLVYRHLLMPRMDGVVSVTEATTRSFRTLYRPACPVVTIPTGVDPAVLAPQSSRDAVRRELETPAGSPVLLFVGSLSPEKRPDRLLRLASMISQELPELRLWLAGDGLLRADLEELAVGLGLGSRVRFLGARGDVGTLMRAADLLLLTSDTEGIPRVVLEAGLSGLPVVVPGVGGIEEFVRSGETGVLTEPADEEGTARAVLSVLADPEALRRMGEAARAWVGCRFTIEMVADRYLEFYGRVRRAIEGKGG